MLKEYLLKIKDPISFLTHFLGFLLSVIGLVLLLIAGTGVWELASFAIFGTTMMMMYFASSIYHFFTLSNEKTRLLRKFDHIAIYLFIAGSFTPFTLLLMDGTFKWVMISVVWGIALGGIILKLVWLQAPRWLSVVFYLGMGWLGLVIIPNTFVQIQAAAWWVVAGGLSYTVGAVIYGMQKPNIIPGWFGFHELWHIFVMGGSFCHFWAVYNFLPSA